MLLPYRVEDFVSENHLVRVIDVFVEGLALAQYGFKYSTGNLSSGQPAYSPAALLKLYIYGYLNRTGSSRRLESECCRNLEVIWLLGGLTPTYKTIADFRKVNGKALKAVNKAFVTTCNDLDLYGKELVAIDGSYFKANASQASITTRQQAERALARLEKDIDTYLADLERADQDDTEPPRDIARLEEKLALLRERQQAHREALNTMDARQDDQLSHTDPDARRLKKNGKTVAGYNTQVAVDGKNHLIAAVDVTQDGNDSQQLAPMARQACETLGVEALNALADAGYYSKKQLKDCEDQGIKAYVPEPDKQSQAREAGRFPRDAFRYDTEVDHYLCPAGQILSRTGCQRKGDQINHRYGARASDCASCPLRAKCLPEKTGYRQVYRWEHEDIVERHRERMVKEGRERMRQRSGIVEHPFGTLKLWFGALHFLTRGLEKVTGEMNLMVLCYNLKRATNLLGSQRLIRHFEGTA